MEEHQEVRPRPRRSEPQISAPEVYPPGGGEARFTILDVRAPIEVARGALPESVNVPILEDEERHQVGITYKAEGQRAAVERGRALTREALPARVERWRRVCQAAPTAIACWRGGMRSELAQAYLGEPWVPRVVGGYKALRKHLMGSLAGAVGRHRLLVVGGMTGTGKTELIEALTSAPGVLALDLEGLANHRGSAFGHLGGQPAQQSFENALAARLLLDPGELLVVEDESRRIGGLHLPDALYTPMTRAPVLLLEATIEERVARIHRQYVLEPALDRGAQAVFTDLAAAASRLRKRLGGELVEQLHGVLASVLETGTWREPSALEPFIRPLLETYYDPLYRRSVQRLEREVVARGGKEELTEWLRERA